MGSKINIQFCSSITKRIMPKLVKLALLALAAAQESTTEFTTVDQAALEAAEEAARQAEAEAHAAAEAAAQAAALAARITGTCWSCGVMNNVTDFGPQDTAADMYAKCLTEVKRPIVSMNERHVQSSREKAVQAGLCPLRPGARQGTLARLTKPLILATTNVNAKRANHLSALIVAQVRKIIPLESLVS